MVTDALERPKRRGYRKEKFGYGGHGKNRARAHKKSVQRYQPPTLDVHLISRSLAELLFVVFDLLCFSINRFVVRCAVRFVV
jgi:hypothetical protein